MSIKTHAPPKRSMVRLAIITVTVAAMENWGRGRKMRALQGKQTGHTREAK